MEKTLNILAILSSGRLCGVARQVLQHFEYVDRSRYRLILAGTWLKGNPYPDLFVEAERRKLPHLILHQDHPLDPKPLFRVRRAIRDMDISLVETHGYKPSVIGAAMKTTAGIPWIAFMHGETAENSKIRLYNLINMRLMRSADRVVAVSEAVERMLAASGIRSENIITVHNSIDPCDYEEPGDATAVREKYGIAGHEKVLAVVGRFSPEKGQRYFLEAFGKVCGAVPHVKALLVGEGPDEDQLRAYSSANGLTDKVIFTGYQHAVSPLYAIADLVVMPSLSEGLPNVALEALLHGRPLVATEVGGTPEVVADGTTGLLVPPADPAAMAGAIVRLLGDVSLQENMARNGRELVRDRFSPAAKVGRLTGIYDMLCSAGKGRG